MARIYHLLLFIASISAQNDVTISRWNDDSDELLRDIEQALFDNGIRTITIFSDFDNPMDRFFFQSVLPWLVDNIGHDLRINYRFRNSGRSAGPRMCAMRALRANTYMQAEYLRCEAQGNPISMCIDQTPINRRTYNRCVNRRVNEYVRNSQLDFDTLISEQTPLILLNGRREISSRNPARLLRLICQAYGRTKPVGCLRPSGLAMQPRNTANTGSTSPPVFSSSTSSTTDRTSSASTVSSTASTTS